MIQLEVKENGLALIGGKHIRSGSRAYAGLCCRLARGARASSTCRSSARASSGSRAGVRVRVGYAPSDPVLALLWMAQVVDTCADKRVPQFAWERRRRVVFRPSLRTTGLPARLALVFIKLSMIINQFLCSLNCFNQAKDVQRMPSNDEQLSPLSFVILYECCSQTIRKCPF
jgi:hypothetical protein